MSAFVQRVSGRRAAGRLSALACAIACATASAAPVLPFDALSDVAAERARDGVADRFAPDRALFAELRVSGHVDERLGVPSFLRIDDASPARANAARGIDAVRDAREQLRPLAALYRLSDADIDALVAFDRQTLPNGAQLVRFRQRIGGIDVFRDTMTVLSDADGRVSAIGGALRGENSDGLAQASTAARGFVYDVDTAIAFALHDRGLDGAALAASLRPIAARASDGDYTRHEFALPAKTGEALHIASPLRTRPVWFRLPEGLVPAWYVESDVVEGDGSWMVAHVISAKSGELLFRHNLTAEAAYGYRVWAETTPPHVPFPGPMGRSWHPHPTGTPNGSVAPYTSPSLVTLQNVPFSRNDPWLPDGATQTTGNNVDAYANITGEDAFEPGDIYANISAPGTFDYIYDTSQNPNASPTQRKAAVTQLFFVNNWLHDMYYDSGFDEAAGNAQFDNFGRGGLDGDGIRAQGQDVSGTNNANMTTPADGGQPMMRMYVFNVDGGETDRDGTIDNAVIAHEWGHYISNRLIGDASGLSNAQGTGMGEGWGDTHAMLLTVGEETGPNAYGGTYAAFAYAAGALTAGNSQISNDGYYFGFRRYPYSIDMSRSPLTFRHIQASSSLPPGIPYSPHSSQMNQTHNTGEIWGAMLWECYAGMLRDTSRLDFAAARERMQRYVVTGYKLTPNAPTFVEARDALLAAIGAESPEDFALCAAGFAKRGAGFAAVAPGRDSTSQNGVVEDFDTDGLRADFVSATLDDLPLFCDADGMLDAGETGTLSVSLRNTGFSTIDEASVSFSTTTPGVSFPDGAVVPLGQVTPYVDGDVQIPVALASSAPASIAFDIAWSTPDGFSGTTTATTEFAVNRDITPDASAVDTAEAPQMAWQPTLESSTADDKLWRRIAISTTEHRFHGPSLDGVSLAALVSPPLHVSNTGPLTIDFRHRYRFERDTTAWDGGVIELSTDDGATWIDIGAGASDPYDATLTDEADNPLGNRPAWSGANGAWPNLEPVTIDLGTAYAGQSVRVRFAIGSDQAVGDHGWELDDIAIGGITNTPFPRVEPHRALCATADVLAGADQATTVGTEFGTGLQIAVNDASGNPLANVPVNFTVPASGASATFLHGLTQMTIETDAGGIATTPRPMANAIAGSYDVIAQVGAQSLAIGLTNLPDGLVAPVLQATSDSGASNADRITNADPLVFDVSGCSDGADVSLHVGGTAAGTPAVCAGGVTELALDIGEGEHDVTAVETLGGVDSVPSPVTTVTVDRTPPLAPTFATFVPNGAFDLLVGGDTEPFADIVLSLDGVTPACTATADAAGTWQCNATLPGIGDHVLTIRATDLAGNTGPSEQVTITFEATIFDDGFED